MGNPNTGEIYSLAEGEVPRDGDVPLTSDQAQRLQALDLKERKKQLAELQEQLKTAKPTIGLLESLLNHDIDVQLNPDGHVVVGEPKERPLTMREHLGGEYAELMKSLTLAGDQRLSFDQSEEDNRSAFISRLIHAGWGREDADREWERIQDAPED